MAHQIELLALPEELIAWARKWAEDFGLCAAFLWLSPKFELKSVPRGDSAAWQAALARTPRWILLDEVPFVSVDDDYHSFMRRNQRGISVTIGPVTAEGSRSSSVSLVSGRKSGWRKELLADLEKNTMAGIRATNPMTGASEEYPLVRVTDGARRFLAEGGLMMPAAGWVQYQLPRS